MRIEQVTINASPLIALFRSGQAELLPRLFQQVYVPNAVWREVTDERHQDAASQGIVNANWLLRVNVTKIPDAVRL
jgi:predicted nucleic acid-binding protein